MRICSLLPSATEIVFALGAGDSLVAVTHECDFPSGTSNISKITRSNIPTGIPSAQIDAAVSAALDSEGTLYELNLAMLEELGPDLVITQQLCDVCAVSFDRVQEAAKNLKSRPAVLNLEPHSLEDVLDSVLTVGRAIGFESAAVALRNRMEQRVEAVRQKTKGLTDRPRVFCMEWVDPPYCGGHWMKELVEIAGGRDDLAALHKPSRRIQWRGVLEFAPEIIVLTCCGFDLRRCQQEAKILLQFEGVAELPAARARRIFATDGSAYFSRPGPRIVESLEILAHLIHPELFAAPALNDAFSDIRLGV